MGTSDAHGGSGGAWGGSGINDFIDAPDDESAADLAGHGLEALQSDEGDADDAPEAGDAPQLVIHPPPDVPGASAIPGVRVRGPSGSGGGGGGGGSASGGGGRPRGGGGGRSRATAARAGGRAIAAGFALARGDESALRALGLSLVELRGLGVFDQMKRILDVTIPASGSPHEVEIRMASAAALIALLRDGEANPRAVVEAFVVEYAFEVLITEVGDRLRQADRNGSRAKSNEELLKDAVRAYAGQVELPESGLSADAFRGAIEEVLAQAQQLVPG